MNLGKAIKLIRVEKDILAKQVYLNADISAAHLSQIENRRKLPSFSTAILIALALGLPLSALIKRAEEIDHD